MKKIFQNNFKGIFYLDATGNLLMDTRRMTDSVLKGEMIARQADFDYLVEHAKQEEIEALTKALGIEDWGSVKVDEFNAKITELGENGTLARAAEQIERMNKAREKQSEPAKALPHIFTAKKADGVYHYTSEHGADIAVMKEGDSFFIYDYNTKDISNLLSLQEINKFVRKHYVDGNAKLQNAAALASTADIAAQSNAEIKNTATSTISENVQVTGAEGKGENSSQKTNIKDNLVDSIDSYTDEEIASITRDSKNRIANSFEDVIDFVASSREGAVNGRLFIGKLKSKTSLKIKNDTNVSTYGKSIVLTSDEIKHIFKHHGNTQSESLRGQEAITSENFVDVLEAIFEPDSVSGEMDSNNTVSLIFKKNNNGVTTAVTIVSEKKKALTLKSARITKKKQYISPPSDVQAPNPTPDSELSMNTVSIGNKTISTNSIPDSAKKINPSEQNSSEKISSYEKLKALNEEVARFAEENIKDYKKLSEPNRRAVRAVIRQAKAHGLSDADIKTVASVAAHSGAKIKFSKADCKRKNKKGEIYYVDGFYDIDTDTI